MGSLVDVGSLVGSSVVGSSVVSSVVSVIDMAITGVRARRAVVRRFGAEKVEKGLRWYAAMRTIQMRFMRLPKPQVKRGQRPA